MREYKAVVLGAGGVGKSSLTVQYVQGVYMESYDPTIEDSYRKTTAVDNRECTLEILDTAGVEQFTAMRELYIRNGEGFILVYSVTNEDSLQELQDLREQIMRIKDNANVPMVLVANKCDMEKDRVITPQQGVSVAESWGRVPFYETSAKFRSNVDEIFVDLVRQIMRRDSAFSPLSSRGHSMDESQKQLLNAINDASEKEKESSGNKKKHKRNKSSRNHLRNNSQHSNTNSITHPHLNETTHLNIHHTLPAQKSKRLRSKATRKGSLAAGGDDDDAPKEKDCVIM